MSNRSLKGKAQSMENYELSGSRPLHPRLESVEDDEASCAVSNASNPYQSYFDAIEFQNFDACSFFRWQGFKSPEEAMATNEWLHVVLPWVEKLNRAHASRLRHAFKTTAAKRSRFWEELQESEAQEHLRKTVKTSVLDMQEDMVVLTTEEFKRTTQDELAALQASPTADDSAECSRPATTQPLKRRRSPSPIPLTGRAMPNPFLSPCDEAHDEPVFRTLNQETAWREGDTDYLDLFNTYQQSVTDEVFASLAKDHIADLTPLSSKADSFSQFIFKSKGLDALKAARRGRELTRSVTSQWPALSEISSRVFAPDVRSFDDVRAKLAEENQLHPLVMYMNSIVLSHNHYFQFGPTIPSHLNEREAFVDCTWSFIRGAFTAAGIQTRMLEIAISGSKERKTQIKSRGERLEVARKADGVGMHDQHQIYIAESALIYGATQDKMDEDCWKSKRALRDSWVSQIKAISQDAHPRTGMSVFGSTSHNRQTQFFAMDYKGVFRVRTLTSMTMPVQADSFAAGMQQCILACLEFVLHVLDETERRNLAKKITLQKDREDFLEAAATIPTTSNTPKKGYSNPSKARQISVLQKLLYSLALVLSAKLVHLTECKSVFLKERGIFNFLFLCFRKSERS